MKTFSQFITERIEVDSSFVPVILDSVKSKIVGQNLGNSEIAAIFNEALSQNHISFEPGYHESADSDLALVFVSLAVVNDDGSITIQYMDDFYTVFDDGAHWSDFVRVVRKLVEHELVHRHQIEKISQRYHGYERAQILRKLESDPSKLDEYLGSSTEIPAFAHQAIIELRQAGYDDKDIKDFIRSPWSKNNSIGPGESSAVWLYLNWFQREDVALKRFLAAMHRAL